MRPKQAIGQLSAYARVCRPEQWVKNVFVMAPAFFSERIGNLRYLSGAIGATACFCLLSSAVYIFNDICDATSDSTHPRKRKRPIASGQVTVPEGAGLITLLFTFGSVILAWQPVGVWVAAGCYLANSLLYCLWIKRRVIADVLVIAIGFDIRLLAGCAAVEVEASSWILLCGFSLALLLGFGKRRTEVEQFEGQTDTRAVLTSYDVPKLNALLSIAASVCLMSYTLYTLAPDTVQRHRTSRLVYTVPLVCYGLFRYLFKVQEGKGDGPTEILLHDKAFWMTGGIWVGAVGIILYLRA